MCICVWIYIYMVYTFVICVATFLQSTRGVAMGEPARGIPGAAEESGPAMGMAVGGETIVSRS